MATCRRSSVVLVDSCPVDRASYSRALSCEGFWPFEFGEADPAFWFATTVRPDLFITNALISSALEGLELTRRLRHNERTQALPVIVLSGRTGVGAQAQGADAYLAGCDLFLTKRCPPDEVARQSRALIAYSLLLRDESARKRLRALKAKLKSEELFRRSREIRDRVLDEIS
jgi:PleD family two-component response regulator